jgi:hypothetical protein
VRRDWNGWREGGVPLNHLEGLHWSDISGGVQARWPRKFMCAYCWCTHVDGDIAHSCRHGDAPHRIKVCIIKKSNRLLWGRVINAFETQAE